MDIKKDLLEAAFAVVDQYVDEPIKDNEFTAKDMENMYKKYTQRHWLNILNKGVKDGILGTRTVKGGGKAFWIISQTQD